MSHTPSRMPYVLALVGAGLLVLLAWIGRDRFTPVGPGSRAPDFTLMDVDGRAVSLADQRGRVVLVNIWATWCPPCVEEMPSMQRLYESLDDGRFEILAVSVDARVGERDGAGRPGGDIRAFGEALGLTFPLLHDPTGRIQNLYRTTGVPESFLVGRDGTIYHKVAGATDWDSPRYRELIERLLEG